MTAGSGPTSDRPRGADDHPSLSAADIAARVGGELQGDPAHRVRGVAPLDTATATDVSFMTASKYADEYQCTSAGVVLMKPEFQALPSPALCRVLVAQPLEALVSLLPVLYPEQEQEAGIHATAVLGRGAELGAGVHIGPNAVIGAGARIGERTSIAAGTAVGDGVIVGDDCVFHPGVTLYPGVVVGSRVIIHSGVRLGSDGFGYTPSRAGHRKIRHIGRCIVEDDVEIGANSCIDRGSIGDTVIGAGTKIDNLVHIGHNVRVGRNCLIMAQVGVAGSTRIEDGVVMAGQVGVAGHVRIGANARLGARAGAIGDIPANETWSGFPARPHKEAMRSYAAVARLARLMKRLENLLKEED